MKKIKSIYIIGALKNTKVLTLENELKERGFEPFAEWLNPGPEADCYWRKYERKRGRSYIEALNSYHAKHVFEFDLAHLKRCDAAVMLMPAGKSGHTELGFCRGLGKPAFILFDKEPKRYDLMHRFATEIFMNKEEFFKYLSTK